MRGAKPRKIRCGWGEEERLPVEIRWDTGKFCLNWLRSEGSNQLSKMSLTFWKVKHCNSQPQQEHKQQENKQHKPRKSEGQEVWVPKVGRRLPVEFRSVVLEAFFWMQAKFVTIGH